MTTNDQCHLECSILCRYRIKVSDRTRNNQRGTDGIRRGSYERRAYHQGGGLFLREWLFEGKGPYLSGEFKSGITVITFLSPRCKPTFLQHIVSLEKLSAPHVWHRSASHSRTARKHGHCFVTHCALQRHPGNLFWPEYIHTWSEDQVESNSTVVLRISWRSIVNRIKYTVSVLACLIRNN